MHRDGVVCDEGTGITIWSRIPPATSEIRYLVFESRPSIYAELRLAGELVNYVGLHPLPTGLPANDGAGRPQTPVTQTGAKRRRWSMKDWKTLRTTVSD